MSAHSSGDDIEGRIRRLEDIEDITTVINAFETIRDGRPEDANLLANYLSPEVRFYWSLEDIEIKGRDALLEYLREGMAPRVWCRHSVTNLQIVVDGETADARWYVMAESIARPDPKRVGRGDSRARQREPATTRTIIHSSTKGSKHAVLGRSRDGWQFVDYEIDMGRIDVSHIKVE